MAKEKKPFYLLEIMVGNIKVHLKDPIRYPKGSNEFFALREEQRGTMQWLTKILSDDTLAVGEGKRIFAKPYDSLAWVTEGEAEVANKSAFEKLKKDI